MARLCVCVCVKGLNDTDNGTINSVGCQLVQLPGTGWHTGQSKSDEVTEEEKKEKVTEMEMKGGKEREADEVYEIK